MKLTGGPASVRLKLILLVIASIIAIGTFVYTQMLVVKLQERERRIAELYASSLEFVANTDAVGTDYTFPLDIIKRIDFPLILTDSEDNPLINGLGGIRNLEVDSTLSDSDKVEFVKSVMDDFRQIHNPIPVFYNDSLLLNKIYYGNSKLVESLRYYPYLQILFALLFILISYISFSYIKKTEQSNIWVGMAKETAHQLGTPISSLLGWQEILKLNFREPDKVIDVADEMNSDLIRLNKIASRFSKIGSKPELKDEYLYEVITKVIEYFKRRLPHSSKTVSLSIQGDKNLTAKINCELFEWVIENLIKNALDAIDTKTAGKIDFKISESINTIDVEIHDTGKGIDLKHRKDIFRPGYSTKRRGWGLGLSLSKRIIKDYHKGKIFVKNSILNQGTTFQISLRK